MPYITYQSQEVWVSHNFYDKYKQFKRIGARLFVAARVDPNITLADLVKKYAASTKLASIKAAGWQLATEKEAARYETLRSQLSKKVASRAIFDATVRLEHPAREHNSAQRALIRANHLVKTTDSAKIIKKVETLVAQIGGWPTPTMKRRFERACFALETAKRDVTGSASAVSKAADLK